MGHVPVNEKLDHAIATAVRQGECLIVQIGANGNGYARLWEARKGHYVHRMVLERKLGRPLLPGMVARHRCHNRRCIEEAHLEEGTEQDNVEDSRIVGNRARSLSEPIVLDIRRRSAEGESATALAREYSVTQSAVSRVISRETWSHV